MTEYKVGDKIRVMRDDEDRVYFANDLAVVTEVCGEDLLMANFSGHGNPLEIPPYVWPVRTVNCELVWEGCRNEGR